MENGGWTRDPFRILKGVRRAEGPGAGRGRGALEAGQRAVWEGNAFRLEPAEWKEEAGEAALSPLRQWILDYLKEHGESAMPDVVKAAAEMYSEAGIRKAVKLLEQEGVVSRRGSGTVGKGNAAFIRLSSSEEGEP